MAGRTPPRSRVALERRVVEAASEAERAVAHFELALFHDNNSREAEAIPHYEAALLLGLAGEQRAECLAWLSSSLYKTARPSKALERLQQSRALTSSEELKNFLAGLERRIRRKLDASTSKSSD